MAFHIIGIGHSWLAFDCEHVMVTLRDETALYICVYKILYTY